GARVPLYGPANTVVHPEVAVPWIEAVLNRSKLDGREVNDAIFALAQMARVSGDRARDLDASWRDRVITRLVELGAGEATIGPVREYRELAASREGVALGDALPVGLRLVEEEGS